MESIESVINKIRSLKEENRNLLIINEKLKEDCDFWQREAIASKSELGEKLIKSTKLDDLITDMAEHICDNLCRHPSDSKRLGISQDMLECICAECKLGKYVCDILNLDKES